MFDNLRQQAESSPFIEEEDLAAEARPKAARGRFGGLLGLTPVQRFVLAFMLFLNVCMLGSFCLLAAERIVLPF